MPSQHNDLFFSSLFVCLTVVFPVFLIQMEGIVFALMYWAEVPFISFPPSILHLCRRRILSPGCKHTILPLSPPTPSPYVRQVVFNTAMYSTVQCMGKIVRKKSFIFILTFLFLRCLLLLLIPSFIIVSPLLDESNNNSLLRCLFTRIFCLSHVRKWSISVCRLLVSFER